MPAIVQSELSMLKSSAVNLNGTGDVASFTGLPASIVIDSLKIFNWSGAPGALLALTLRDAASGGGNSLVGAVSGLNAIVTATSLAMIAHPEAVPLGVTRVVTTGALYLNVSAANGSALTGDVLIRYHATS